MLTKFAATVVLLLPLTHAAIAGEPANTMTNSDVIAMAQAGIGDDIIVEKIHAAPATDFDTGVDGLKALQAAHVSNTVVRTMISPHASLPPGNASAPAASTNTSDPDATHPPGIYMYDTASNGHRLTELQRAKLKQTKGKGAYLSGLTYGIKKFKVLSVFDGADAPVKTHDPNPAFYLYIPPDNSSFGGSYVTPNQFTLVKLTQKGDSREIVAGSGSIWGTSMGTDDKATHGVTVDQVKPGIYKLSLLKPLPPGEYAFSQNAGVFYDFEILVPE